MQKVNLYIPQATTWSDVLTFVYDDGTPVSLANYSFQGAFKTSYYTANVTDNLVFTITSSANGIVTMSYPAANSAAVFPKTYVYDVFMTDANNVVTRILSGELEISPSVTR